MTRNRGAKNIRTEYSLTCTISGNFYIKLSKIRPYALTNYQLIVIISIDSLVYLEVLKMAKSTLIKTVHTDCPICNTFHQVEERARMTNTIMKQEKIFYEEHFYICKNTGEQTSKERNEFKTEALEDSNLMSARNAYRRAHNLLTSDEIVSVRENYGLTQVEFAKLLGWGEATIARYESKAIQDEAYDTMLRMIQENPLMAIKFLDKNGDKFQETKRMQIRTKMIEKLDTYGKEYLSRQTLIGTYVKFSIPSDFNGYKILDINKIECIISYYAEQLADLYKTQLMNMLWYADVLYFKSYNNSMTGLVYRHELMGAFPIGHKSLTHLKNINIQAEEEYESTKYHFYPNTALDMSEMSKNELVILDSVIAKFRNYNVTDIVDCIREEAAFQQTNQHDIIPYSLAKKTRVF